MPMPSPSTPVILFLQGPPSGFWPELAAAFETRGAKILRVNFSAGDWLYWQRDGALNYRGSLADWPRYVEALIRENGVTDIVYYTDRLPYHVEAAYVADALGVRCHSIEFGYLRPDWLTLERGGMGSYSHFPIDPAVIRAIAAKADKPDMSVRYTHTFGQEAFNEVVYNLAGYFGKPFFRRYEADRYYDPFFEYLMWLPRLVLAKRAARRAKLIEQTTLQQKFWLLGMQLQSDYQVRANSHYGHLGDMLDEVIGSFAGHADRDDHLLIKLHPLDNGYERWEKVASEAGRRHGVADRIAVIDGGDLNALIAKSKGVIIVNSTVGLHSLQAGRPTKVLGIAVYDIKGLTHQGSLDSFWTAPEPVDASLVEDLVLALAATIQVKGNFYNRAGRSVGAKEIVERILRGRVNEPGAFVVPPPRLAEGEHRRSGGKARPIEPATQTGDERLPLAVKHDAVVLPFKVPAGGARTTQPNGETRMRQREADAKGAGAADGSQHAGRSRSKGDFLPRPS